MMVPLCFSELQGAHNAQARRPEASAKELQAGTPPSTTRIRAPVRGPRPQLLTFLDQLRRTFSSNKCRRKVLQIRYYQNKKGEAASLPMARVLPSSIHRSYQESPLTRFPLARPLGATMYTSVPSRGIPLPQQTSHPTQLHQRKARSSAAYGVSCLSPKGFAAAPPVGSACHINGGTSCCATAAASTAADGAAAHIGGNSITTVGGAMLKRLEADCERASRGTRQRAEEFAKFIDRQMAELEELATESARLQAEVKELNTKTEQNLQEVEALLEEDKASCPQFMVVSRQDLHARKEWRSRVDAYKFTHGIRIHQQRGKPFTRICFLGLYKELAQLECHLDVSLEDQSCQEPTGSHKGLSGAASDLIAVSEADIQCIHDPKNASPPYAPAFLVSDCMYLDLEFALALVRGSTLILSLDSMLSFSRLCLHLILAKPLLPPLCPRNPHLAAAAPVSSATAAHDCIAIPLPFWDVPVMYSLARVLFDLFFLCDSVVGAWPEAPLSELCALYAEGRVSFTALVSHSRLIFKAQLTRMSHAQKLVALHEQQRQRQAEEKQEEAHKLQHQIHTGPLLSDD
ncbi:hypothetical protein cyc_04091 [Cyclospora cayetanensis]|uniref:Uncharacterized protein n=1 Tax=Cyclospora cayetanensis TaxID=88456 RepID=A0A1D3CZD6_9EIME|nr:hypothetical protein cyc_04091 [Cyclospora cayetanensis]